jgi:type I restriction enzyme S subunit
MSADFVTAIPSDWVAEDTRLDASYYGQAAGKARVLVEQLRENGVRIETVGSLTEEIFRPSIHTREYTDEENGDPYLTPTDMFMFPLRPRKYITNYPDGLQPEPGWLLITCSGTVGRINIANEYLADCVLSQNLIRTIPKDGLRGYLFAYLNSWIGQAFLAKDKYGATVKHINPEHVADIPVPVLPGLVEELNDDVETLWRHRTHAEKLERDVTDLFQTELGLTPIGELTPEYLAGEESDAPDAYTTTASDLNRRLDAPYHRPIIQAITEEIATSEHGSGKVGDVITRMFVPSRFKRPYVDDEAEGIPFVSGTHLEQIKPLGIKYLWAEMDGIEDVLLERGWVLMSRSGTVGRIRIVDETIEGWAASEHVLRLVPDSDIHPGYLAAFLHSPYGQRQIDGKVYGAVVDEIAERDTSLIEEIDILLPAAELQALIGEKVMEAYERIGNANTLEARVIERLTTRIDEERDVR